MLHLKAFLKSLVVINYFVFFILTSLFNLSENKKPNDKEQQAVWRFECELGIIADSECPIDGGWTPWSPWSACHGNCDDVGYRRRLRECNNPAPSQDGLSCTGADSQLEPCYLTNCTIDDYRKLVAGDISRNAALKQLETVPKLMEHCLLTECPFEVIEAALVTENTWQINPEALWNSLQCVKHNLGCPVPGEWGTWGEWSPCGARCGYGLRWRLRKCDTPPPSSVHLICSGTPLQVEECQGDQCAVHKRDSGGNWGEWGAWSTCSEKCGVGTRRRKRTCLEMNTPRLFSSWGTHCRGQYNQLEICEDKECKLDGGWSGWGAWSPCSQTCGAGKYSRSRSCTRPEPSGSGTFCSGARTEVGSCHLKPCNSFTHTVAVFNGESFLEYNFKNKRSTLFQFYVRFLPLSPHGTLVRRGTLHNPLIRLNIQKWHICLDAEGLSRTCTVSRICTRSAIEPATWHSVLITVTSIAITLRLNDEPVPIRSTFSCDPELPNEKVHIFIGERLHGEIQEVILNFIPLCFMIDRNRVTRSIYCPDKGSNIAYEKAGVEEAYFTLLNDQYLSLPCFRNQDEWQIKLTIKSKTETGTILFMLDKFSNSWLHLYLQNMRLKLKLAVRDFRSESISSSDCPSDQWLDLTLSKKRDANIIEMIINIGERLHVLFEELEELSNNGRIYGNNTKEPLVLCTDEFFVGGVPAYVKTDFVYEDFTSLSGIIATIIVNNNLLDLNTYNVERYKDDIIQLSSRTASVSGSYHETAWGKSNRLNLTCLHARSVRSPNSAHWLFLDTLISSAIKDKRVRSIDDGRVLRLVATVHNNLRGFYTCRAHSNKYTRNIVTYGVLGQMNHKLSGPDFTTAIAVITTVALVLGTLICLFIEGVHDIRNGYGFFRDAHMSPEEEAEAVCEYIDKNMHLMANKIVADAAKAKARRIGRQLACHSSFSVQEPEGLMQIDNLVLNSNDESAPSEPEGLPALPEIKSSSMERTHDVYRAEQSYVSSPRHGTISSPRTKLTSTSSLETSSPRILCSRLLLAKRLQSSRERLNYNNKISTVPRKKRSKMLTIKSTTYVNDYTQQAQSPAHKILQKFRELKYDDI